MKHLYDLPAWIHEAVLCITGYRIVEITDTDGSKHYVWSDHYPL